MPRYENGNKFIDVRLHGSTVMTTAGRVGGTSKTREAWYPPELAAGQFAAAITAAEAKGFIHVATLRTPVENRALEAPIAENPDDDDARIVYGDWLLERGDPRGDLIALQRQLAVARPAKAKSLRNRETELLDEHSSLLFGPLDEVRHVQVDQGQSLVVTWRLGFFEAVTLRFPDRDTPRVPSLTRATEQLVQLHSARFLRHISFGGAGLYRGALAALARLPPTLRSLEITKAGTMDKRVILGSLAPVCGAHPQLRRLALELDADPLYGLELPGLEELDLHTPQLTRVQLDALERAPWPALTSLSFWFAGMAVMAPSIAHWLTPARFPRLATLRITPGSIWVANELATALAHNPLLDQLTSLHVETRHRETQAAFRTRIPHAVLKFPPAW